MEVSLAKTEKSKPLNEAVGWVCRRKFQDYQQFKVLCPGRSRGEMFVPRVGGQWICRACRNSLAENQIGKRLFQSTRWRGQSVEELPAGLILRAQKMARQHRELEQKAAIMTEYTPQTVQLYKRISELEQVATNLKEFQDARKVTEESPLLIVEYR